MRGNRTVAALLILIALVGLLGRPYSQLMPAVQRDVLHVGATGLGMLMAFSSIGALIGALAIASLSNFSHRGLLLTISVGMMPLSSMVLGTIGDFTGVPMALIFGGIGCLGSLILVSMWVSAVRTAS